MDMIRFRKFVTLRREMSSIGGALITMTLFVFGSMLAVAVAVLLVPIVFAALLTARWGFRVSNRAEQRRGPPVIDAEYEVIE